MAPYLAAPLSLGLLALAVHAHRHWLALFPEDPPGTGRHQHLAPTPMAGWVAVLAALVGLATASIGGAGAPVSWWVVAGIGLATVTGYLDDRGKAEGGEMPWWAKALLLVVAGALVLVDQADTRTGWEHWVVAFCWLFALTNAVNFMDNTDGVAAALGGLGLLLVAGGEGALAWAGCAFLGFLPGNWPRPRVFLGDSGALGLGLLLAWATLPTIDPVHPWSTLPAGLWPAILPVAVFVIDFVQVIAARVLIGHPPWVGDRRHLTHIAISLGVPRVWIAPLFAALGGGLYWLG